MTFANVQYNRDQLLQNLQNLSVDDQLAALWYAYEIVGDSIQPGGPKAAGFDIAQSLVNQMKKRSEEEQLQIQRDIVGRVDTALSREYGSNSNSTKLAFWYIAAQETEAGNLVPVPEDYEISSQGEDLLDRFEDLEFDQQIDFIGKAVLGMGVADSVQPQQV